MQLEMNAPAGLKVYLEFARKAIMENKLVDALDVIRDADDLATQLLEYFRFLASTKIDLPMGWTEFVTMRSRKKKVRA